MATGASVNMSGSGVLDPRILHTNDAEFTGLMNMSNPTSTTTTVDQNPYISEARQDLKSYMGQLPGNVDLAARDTMERARNQAEGIRQQTMGDIAKSGAGLRSGAAQLKLSSATQQQADAMKQANTTMGIQGREQYGNLLSQQAGLAGTAAGHQATMTGMQNQLLQTQQQANEAKARLELEQNRLELAREELKNKTELERQRMAMDAAAKGIGAVTGTQSTVASMSGGLGVRSPYQGNISAGGTYSRWL